MNRRFAKLFRFTAWLLIYAFILPTPAVLAAHANENSGNAHVHRRLNSPERAASIAKAASLDAAARDAAARSETAVPAPSAPRTETTAQTPSRVAGAPSAGAAFPAASRPKSVGEVLFNYGASFMGVPGLAPQRGVDGSFDEGLGFHQDGTARKVGGVAGTSGPSDRGQRANTFMRSGLQNGYGSRFGYVDPNDPFGDWRYGDSTAGGRKTGNGIYSRDLSDFDPLNMAIDRGLNYGAGFINSMGEAALSGLVDGGRARLNFRLDRDGYFSGEGDALLPFYDSGKTTIYTQLGARSMRDSSDTRWIGNFGLGQRWFPLANSEEYTSADYDAGTLMLGYNAFFDYDFTRNHQRGGVGAEVWYDWLRLSSNYYFPISSWKGSEDFDSRFVKERPAEGWDARVKAYLPFYRNVALTGAYSQWYGDHVGMFGANRLEKDPKVWSYGVEYTPIPLVSAFITQKSTERGRSDTEFGLTFTYHFQMPWEDQTSHSKVAQLRTVGGSRHEFVDRENRIILEYKAKKSYRIEYLGPNGGNVNEFVFRIVNGFDEFMPGQTVRVTAAGVTLAEAPVVAPEKSFLARAGEFIGNLFSIAEAHAADGSQTYITDGQGRFIVRVSSATTGPVTVTIQAGENTQSFTLNVVANLTWELDPVSGSGTLTQGVPGSLTLTLTQGGVTKPGISVSFTPNPDVSGLPGSATTDANGQIILSGLTVLTPTDQTIIADIDGQKLNIQVTVIPGTYTLEATPDTSTQFAAADVTFTVKQGGLAVPAGMAVTFTANTNFANLPTGEQQTNAAGQIVVTGLSATTSGSQSIEATVSGQNIACVLTINASNLQLIQTPVKTFPVGADVNGVSFTLTDNGQAVPSASLSLSWSGAGAFASPPSSINTDGSGAFSLNLKGQTAGSVTLTATLPDSRMVTCTLTVSTATLSLTADGSNPDVRLGQTQTLSFTLSEATLGPVVNTAISAFSVTGAGSLSGPSSTQTDASGKIAFDVLGGSAAGNATVSVTTALGTITATVPVLANVYALTNTTASGNVEAWSEKALSVVVTKDGVAVPDGETVTWTIQSGSARFGATPGTSTTTSLTSSGSATIPLKTTGPGAITVQASIGGYSADVSVTAIAPTYSLTAGATPSPQSSYSATPEFSVTVKNSGGDLVENTQVSWSSTVSGGNTTPISAGTSTSNSSGVASRNIGPGAHSTIIVTAAVGVQSATFGSVQFGDNLPSGIIAYMNGPTDNWDTANNFCQSHGGNLPNSGFQAFGSLPMQTVYWGNTSTTGLTHAAWLGSAVVGVGPGRAYWSVVIGNGNFFVVDLPDTRVACVP